MTALTDPLRIEVWAELQRTSDNPGTVTKDILRAAVDAADDWAEANAAAFNSALPVAARTALTAKQKARLLLHVIEKRWVATT